MDHATFPQQSLVGNPLSHSINERTKKDSINILLNLLSSLTPARNLKEKEATENQQLVILKAVNFLFSQSLVDATISVLEESSSSIRYLRSYPSNRKLVLCREYYCFIGDLHDKIGCNKGHTHNSSNSSTDSFYCSCRSFYERSKRQQEEFICKHLLAVILAPFLGTLSSSSDTEHAHEEVIQEEEFIELYLAYSSNI